MKTTRRKFVSNTIKLTMGATLGSSLIVEAACSSKVISSTASLPTSLQFTQLALPYEKNSLEPYIDALTMDIHYSKHHTAYVKNVNDAIASENISYQSETEFFANTSKLSAKARNNGGGAYNHNFFWMVMKPNGGGAPSGKIADAINGSFGSFEKFKEQFALAGMSRFGSGWAWLIKDNDKLKIGSTANQDNPLMDISDFKGTPLLALDVWEHAYYLKYQNKRNEYIANWWNVVNWDEVAKRL
jgi:superoxide dismutase, Fe-Mn family